MHVYLRRLCPPCRLPFSLCICGPNSSHRQPSSASNCNLMHNISSLTFPRVLEGLQGLSGFAPPWYLALKVAMMSPGIGFIISIQRVFPRGDWPEANLLRAPGEATFLSSRHSGLDQPLITPLRNFHPSPGPPQGSGRGSGWGVGQGRVREVPLQVPELPSEP